MKRVAMIAVGLVTVLGLTGCGSDWFGNDEVPPTPHPTITLPPETCDAGEVDAPVDPLTTTRPREVPPHWRWVVIAPEVRALKPNDIKTDHCVPFSVHVYATMQGYPALAIVEHGLVQMLPYDRQRVTPWTGTYLLLAYDPESPDFETPPEYFVDLVATYLPERDVFGEGPLSAFRCAIRVNGATVVQQIALAGSHMVTRCQLRHNFYNP